MVPIISEPAAAVERPDPRRRIRDKVYKSCVSLWWRRESPRRKRVSRFRSSHHCAAASFANFGIEGH